MKTTSSQASTLAFTVANSIVLALALAAAGPAAAGNSVQGSADSSSADTPACSERQPLAGLDARVVAKAAQGVDSLRNFIEVSRGVYGLEMASTVAWLDRQRAAEAACNIAVATPRR